MAVKYISKQKTGKWGVATSKQGKSSKNFATQKEALVFCANQNNTESIYIKRSSGWQRKEFWERLKTTPQKETSSKKKASPKKETPVKQQTKSKEKGKGKSGNGAFAATTEKLKELTQTKDGNLTTWAGLLIGLVIVFAVVGIAFLIGFLI